VPVCVSLTGRERRVWIASRRAIGGDMRVRLSTAVQNSSVDKENTPPIFHGSALSVPAERVINMSNKHVINM
jgi:hypothetical protein